MFLLWSIVCILLFFFHFTLQECEIWTSNLPDALFISHLGQGPILDLLDELSYKREFGGLQGQGIRILNEKETVHAEMETPLDNRMCAADLLLESACMLFKQRLDLCRRKVAQESQPRRKRGVFCHWLTDQRAEPVNKLSPA